MKYEKKFAVTDSETLRAICIRKRWFTQGSSRQYEKLFDINDDPTRSAADVALIIWLCSDADYEEIFTEIQSLEEEYLTNLGLMQAANGERAADEIYCGYFD